MEPPKQPPNADVITQDGQFTQLHSRWWQGIAGKAYSAIQSFNEFFSLDTIGTADPAADYLLIYDADQSVANKVLADDLLSFAQGTTGNFTGQTWNFYVNNDEVVVNCGSALTIAADSSVTITLNVAVQTPVMFLGATWFEANNTDRFAPKVSATTTQITVYNTNSVAMSAYWTLIARPV